MFLFQDLIAIFSKYADSKDCECLSTTLETLSTQAPDVGLFGRATLLAIAQIALKALHVLTDEDVMTVLLLLLQHNLLTRDSFISIASSVHISAATFLTTYLSEIVKLSPHQKALVVKYAVLSYRPDTPLLDEALFRAITTVFQGGCTVGPYATLRNLFLSGACNHKTRYGDCLGTKLLDEYITAEGNKHSNTGTAVRRVLEGHCLGTDERQHMDLSMLSSAYSLLKGIRNHGNVWVDIAKLPPVDTYVDMRAKDDFRKHLHTYFMTNELSLYLLVVESFIKGDKGDALEKNYMGTFTLLDPKLTRASVMSLIHSTERPAITAQYTNADDIINAMSELFSGAPKVRDSRSEGVNRQKDPPVMEPAPKKVPIEQSDNKSDITAHTCQVAPLSLSALEEAMKALEEQDENQYSEQLEEVAKTSFDKFLACYHHNYIFIAGNIRGLDPAFVSRVANTIYLNKDKEE